MPLRERLQNIGVALLLAVFVNFVFANTVFIHTHHLDRGIVTHSHPYLPSSHHGHTAESLGTVFVFNTVAGAFEGATDAVTPVPECTSIAKTFIRPILTREGEINYPSLRDPPASQLKISVK